LYEPANPVSLRAAALSGLAKADPQSASSLITKALLADDAKLHPLR